MKEPRDEQGKTLAEFLAEYDPGEYERPSVTVDIALFTLLEAGGFYNLGVLLVKRGRHPYIHEYALPGGFVELDEELEKAAARELYEETGAEGLLLRPFGVFGAVGRDPRTRVISVGHYAVAPMGSVIPKAGDDAAAASFFIVETQLEAKAASAETYRMTLFGSRILTARAKLRYDMLGSYPAAAAKGDLAADHAHVLFSALVALNVLPRDRVARLLALGRQELEGEAVDALDRALSRIPKP
ncbi:MAG: NUDIX hydrolase [Clostridiaceae bacterium]